MKKDLKQLIKRLTLLAKFYSHGKGWISVDGDGAVWFSQDKPYFCPSGEAESLDYWGTSSEATYVSRLDNMPLSMVCPSLSSKDALFYTDGETVWLIEK